MKKILFLISAIALINVVISCSDDDDPKRGNGTFTVSTSMVNHMVNTTSGEAIGIASTTNKITLNTVNQTAELELHYLDGNIEKTLKLDNVIAKPTRLSFYELSSPSDASLSGYVDINEGVIMRFRYTTPEGIRIISTMPEVFFMKTQNTVTYDDTTKTSTYENTMYQFYLTPASLSAIVKVMDIVHDKDLKHFKKITASSVPVTVTPNGFIVSGENLKTNAKYISTLDSLGGTEKDTDKYPFKTFNATIDLVNDQLNATYMIGSSATVVATGSTYPDYTSY